MKLIPLTQGKVAMVDDDDYNTLSKLKWYAHNEGAKRDLYYAKANFDVAWTVTFLFAIPWYVYAGLLVVVGIVGYSFAWCANKELIPEDYTSDVASNVTFIQSTVVCLIGAIIVSLAFGIEPLLAIPVGTIGIIMFMSGVLSFINVPSWCYKDWSYYLCRFVGAVVTHYRKRVRWEV